MYKLRKLLLLLPLLLLLSGCGNGNPNDTNASSSSGGGGGGKDPGTVATGGTPAQTIKATSALTFDPSTASAKVGDIVQWKVDAGSPAHNVTFDSGLASDLLQPGDTYTIKLTTPGTYSYKCTIHAGMNGTLTVT